MKIYLGYRFVSKYDCKFISSLDDANSSHVQILRKITSGSLVLEFGPASGILSEYMKNNLDCKIFAVEIDAKSAESASTFCEKVIVDNIESNMWKEHYEGMLFDYIIFADVLEHLYSPWDVLKEIKIFLKPSGKILLSLPNIAHNAVIMNLMQDQFEYRNLGLLDNTHIRFFTKTSIDQMINDCGYHSVSIGATFVLPHNTEFKNEYADFNWRVSNELMKRKYRHVYQFIYEVEQIRDNKNNVQTIENLDESISRRDSLKLFFRVYFLCLFNPIKKIYHMCLK